MDGGKNAKWERSKKGREAEELDHAFDSEKTVVKKPEGLWRRESIGGYGESSMLRS